MSDHLVTVAQPLNLNDVYDVTCTCGFEVTDLSSREAAIDTANWHQGKPSLLGDVSGIAWAPDAEVSS